MEDEKRMNNKISDSDRLEFLLDHFKIVREEITVDYGGLVALNDFILPGDSNFVGVIDRAIILNRRFKEEVGQRIRATKHYPSM
jgi:hypothetical protein